MRMLEWTRGNYSTLLAVIWERRLSYFTLSSIMLLVWRTRIPTCGFHEYSVGMVAI